MYNSQYYTCEQVDQRLLQGYLDDYNSENNTSLTKSQFLSLLATHLNSGLIATDIVQESGNNMNKIMSQAIVTQLLSNLQSNINARDGYYQATISDGTITVNAPDYILETGGNLRIKMPSAGTTESTLTIGNANAVQLWYNGAAVSAQNTWEANEIISVFYDGTRFMASNSQGGGGKAEKVSYDNSQSGLAAGNVQGAVDELSEGVSVKPSLIFDDSNHIFNIVDKNGNILAYWDSNGNFVFKKEIDIIDEWHYNIPSLSPSTDEKGGFFTSSGEISYIGINTNAAYFGWGKADVEEYRGKTIYIRNKVVSSAYNLFVDEQGSVLEAWQQNGTTIAKVVPNTAKYILLSNNFYSSSGADAMVNPAAYFVDGFKFLIDYFKNISFDKINVKAQDDDSENILNITDKSGNILAYFDKDGYFHANIASEEFEMFLPEYINSYVGDTLQLFKYPMTLLADFANYGVNLSVDTDNNNIRKYGKTLIRYFEFIPLATGTYRINANVMDTRRLKILAEKTITINVLTPTNPESVVNILCIGDSETQGQMNNSGITAADGTPPNAENSWTNELKERMTTSRAATAVLPAGLGLTNIHLIGTRNTSGGRHEGYGGWDGADFLSSRSPFYKSGAINFNAYLAQDSVYDDTEHKGVDIIYILLGANTTKTVTRHVDKLIMEANEHRTQIINLLNTINTQLRTDSSKPYYNPNLKVVLLNYVFSWTDGHGYHPYGSGIYDDGCYVTQAYIACHRANKEIAEMDDYKDWVDCVLMAPQIDSEYAYLYINKQKNVYMSETEINHIEQVHPNALGYKMFGAAVMRDLLGRI